MKVAPTLAGGLRIDAEDPHDWDVLRMIVPDAVTREGDLATSLGGLSENHQAGEDWQEFVAPELRSMFDSQLATVGAAIEEAAAAADNGPGPLTIPRPAAEAWYGALNQARLALEERHRFHNHPAAPPDSMPPERRSAWFRSQFYLVVQGILLDHVLIR